MASCEKYRIGLHLLEPELSLGLPGQIKRLVAGRQNLTVFAGQPADDRRPCHAVVAGNIDALSSKIEQQRLGHDRSCMHRAGCVIFIQRLYSAFIAKFTP